MRSIIILVSLLLAITLSIQSGSAAEEIASLTLDFEDGIEDWEPYRVTSGSEFSVEIYPEEDGILGKQSVKLVDNTIYRLRFNETGGSLNMTDETQISFQWMFKSISGGAYSGLRLYTYDFGSLYIFSHFAEWFLNTSYVGIIQIDGEETNIWYNHTIDLYQAYFQTFGEIPATIDLIDLIHQPIGGASYSSGQITLFDNIIIGQPTPTDISYPLFGAVILIPLTIGLMYIKKRRNRRM